jgi:hypothetical protein
MATVSASDHRDSPGNVADAAADGTDIYAFRSPTNSNNLVVALLVNPLIAPSDNATRGFDPNVSYALKIDRNGDLVPEATVTMKVSGTNMVVEGLGSSALTFPITPPNTAAQVTTSGGISAFAGQRDDPFFFDLTGFQTFVAGPKAPVAGLRAAGGGSPSDTFAGTNIDAIVIELPITAVTGGSSANSGTIKVVAQVLRNGKIVDRMSIPAVNTALVPSSKKDNFNMQADERRDVPDFMFDIATSITNLRGAVDPLFGGAQTQGGGPLGNLTPQQLAGALVPYVVTIDFSKPVSFPNGRQLQEDVIDTVLGLVLNRGGALGISDGVNANDKAFMGSFPYLAEPHMPAGGAAAAPSTTVRPPNTGDGGLLNDSGSMWVVSGSLFLLAMMLGGAGAFAAIRARMR